LLVIIFIYIPTYYTDLAFFLQIKPGDTRFFIIRLRNIDQNMEIYCSPQILGEYTILL